MPTVDVVTNDDRRRQAGFTLMEIMIVLAIIGLIMGVLVLPKLLDAGDRSRIKAAKTQVKQFGLHYQEWSLDNPGEECPDGLRDLLSLTGRGRRDDLQTKDAWGTPFEMHCGDDAPDGESFGVSSAGPDKRHDTDDDIKSWD